MKIAKFIKICSFILILGLIIAVVSGCTKTQKYPAVSINFSDSIYDTYYIPLRDDYMFTDDLYEIIETEEGYNIVVKCIPKDSPRAFNLNS